MVYWACLLIMEVQSNQIGAVMKEKRIVGSPSAAQVETELNRIKYKQQYWNVMRSTASILILVAAIAVLVATLWLPVLQIYGGSMTPALNEDDIVLSIKSKEYEYGDIIAFYYNNKILVKRVIASSGEWVELDDEGNLYINGKLMDEPYVQEKALGDCDIKMPYQVPEERVFVMGDHRSISVDGRNSAVGCVAEEQIVGRLVFKIWPLDNLGSLNYTDGR